MLRLLPFVLGASIWILPSLVGGTLQPWDEGPPFASAMLVLSLICVGALSALYRDQTKVWWTAAALGFVLGTVGWIVGYSLIVGPIGQPDRLPFATMLVMVWSIYALASWIASRMGHFLGSIRKPLGA